MNQVTSVSPDPGRRPGTLSAPWKAAGTTDTKAVLAKMKSMPVEDFFTAGAHVRADGRLMRQLSYAVAKTPEQMKSKDDLLTITKKFSGEEAFVPASQSECPALAKK